MLGLCRLLPGGNILNLTEALRALPWRGWLAALLARTTSAARDTAALTGTPLLLFLFILFAPSQPPAWAIFMVAAGRTVSPQIRIVVAMAYGRNRGSVRKPGGAITFGRSPPGGIQRTPPRTGAQVRQSKHFNTDFTEKKVKPQI